MFLNLASFTTKVDKTNFTILKERFFTYLRRAGHFDFFFGKKVDCLLYYITYLSLFLENRPFKMKTKILAIFLWVFGLSFLSYGQNCFTIDFENIPGAVPFEGLEISDQFFAEFGVSFILEDDERPILAEVGSPVAGFSSFFGEDTPADGVDIGQFFLTDDGELQGLDATGLIINFDQPLASIEGCIIDIDFGEKFVLEARDLDDLIIAFDTIVSGDPGTGDGQSTCWEFIANNCEGISSVRLKGFRTQAGGFGYGVDNIIGCFLEDAVEVSAVDPPCNTSDGVISISAAATNGNYLFSIDGGAFQTDSVFTNLSPGTYLIRVRNDVGCIFYEEEIEITSTFPLLILNSTPISCNGSDASIEASGLGGTPPYEYSIDGLNYQVNPTFENLDEGFYTIYIQDALGCITSTDVNIEPNVPLSLNTTVNPTTCGENNGSVEIFPIGPFTFEFSIDGGEFQTENSFGNLSPGLYTLTIQDEFACTASEDIIIDPSDSVRIESIDSNPSSCEELNGALSILASGGTGVLSYQVNGFAVQTNPEFINLAEGLYVVEVFDEEGCSDKEEVDLAGTPALRIENVSRVATDCGESNGILSVEPSGGTGRIRASINNELFQPFYDFENLTFGDYLIQLSDELGCTVDTLLRVGQNDCPFYIPNAFSPNEDGANDLFTIYPHPEFQGEFLSLKIFDRWGEFVYEKHNFDPAKDGWDGNFLGEPFNPGVFVYVVELIYGNGKQGQLAGDVHLIR